LSFIVDAISDVIDWVAGAIEDVVEFVFDEVIEPVVSFVGDTVQALLDNPLETIAKVVAIATGNAWAIPLIDGASVAANGGDLGDVLESVAISYVSQAIGGEIAQHTAPFVDEVIGDSLSAGLKEVAVASITQGTVAATSAILYGEDPLEAFARGGITAAVSAGMGKIAEQIGFEVEVTDPDTGQTTTRALPNVVKNVVSAALAAELTGGEITDELIANAVTRGLITTDLVKKYVADNPNIGDRELTYMTAAFQRTAAVALSGGTGEQAAAQIMGVISAYGMEELHDEIRDSGVGDFIGDTLDKISGDYQRVEELTALMDEIGPRLQTNYAEYEEKYNTLQALWGIITGNREQIMMLEADAAEPGLDANNIFARQIAELEAELETAVVEYNRLIEEEGYLDRINELVPLIEADNEALQGYQDDLIEAQNDLQRSADRLDGELTSVYSATDEYLVNAMDPGFNADEYRELNNLPDDVDAYAHFLSEGQHNGAYTSWNQYDIALDNARDLAMNEIMFGGFGIGENSAVWNLTDADRQALQTILRENGYDSPQALNELLTAPGEVREAVFNQWVEAIGSNQNRLFSTGDTLRQADIDYLAAQGYDMRGVAVGTPMSAEEAIALDAGFRQQSGDSESGGGGFGFSEGVTAEDVINGTAILRTGDDGSMQWTVLPGVTRWDPQHGWITQQIFYDEAGNKRQWQYVDQDGNFVPGTMGLVIYGGVQDVDDREQAGLALNAASSGMSWGDIQEGLGWSDTLIDMAQNVMDWANENDTDVFGLFDAQNFLANAMKAGGGILEAFNGMSTLFGIAPDSTALGKFAEQLQNIGAAGNTEEYQAELAKLQEMMSAETDLPEDAAWYERAFARVATIAGAAAEHPSAFISEYIGVEALQELVPLAVGGVATLGAKGAAMAMGRTLSTRMAAGTGLSAAAVTDIAESYGGTAGETYDRALTVALDSINPATGQIYTQEEAEEYAMTLAVQTGAVAATMTAATMGIGGMALEKALLGDKAATGFVGAGIDELASRIANGGTIMIKEGLTEGLEEGLATAFREGHLSQINPDIDVADEVAGAAFMGFIVGGPVSGGAYGVSQVGDAYSNFISAIDPDVRSAIENGNTVAANEALDNLGVTDPVVRNNVLSQVAPDQFVNTAQATTSFLNANPDYTATEAEINSFVQAGSYEDINEQIDRYVDDRYVDVQEVIDAAAAEGVTLTEEQAQQYVGQGPAGHEDAVLSNLRTELGPEYTTFGEAKKFFEDLGFNPTDAQVQGFVGRIAESTQQQAIAEYVDPRQITEEEARAAFEAQGFDPSADDIAAFVGQGNANFESNADFEGYVDPRQVTEAEARAFFNDLGYEATDAQIAAFVGQGGANFESNTGTNVSSYVDPRQVTEAEARAAFEAQGYTPTNEEVAQYVAQSAYNNLQASTETDITSFADPRATTEAEVRAMFEAEGYTPTDAEVQARMGQGGADFESTSDEQISNYVDPRQVTEAEARQFFADMGYDPTDAEVEAYMGQGGSNFESNKETAVGAYVDPRQTTAEEVRAAFEAAGYEATEDQINQFVGQLNQAQQEAAVGEYIDPRQVTENEARQFFSDLGYDATADEIAAQVGQSLEETYQATTETGVGSYVNPRQVTTDEARAFFESLGYEANNAEIASFVGQGGDTFAADQQAAVGTYVDPRQMTEAEVREMFAAQGYEPTDEEVAGYVGQGNRNFDTNQSNAVTAFADPRATTEAEVRAQFEAAGYDPSDEEIAARVGQGNATFESGTNTEVAGYSDVRVVTEAEAQQFFDNLGYEATDDEIADFIGQVEDRSNAQYQSQQQNLVGQYVDPRQVTFDELQAIASQENLTLTEALAEAYVGQGDENFESTNFADARSEYDTLATTTDEARQFFGDLGYTFTDEEVAQFANDSMTEADQQTALGAYVDPRQFTFEEARQYMIDQGYTDPTDEEVNRFVGQGDDAFQATNQDAAFAYVDEFTVTADEVRDMYAELGLVRPTDDDIARFVGQYEESTLRGQLEEYLPVATSNSINGIVEGLEDQIGQIADGDQPATGLYAYIDNAIQDLIDAGIDADEVTQIINDVVGTPATGDSDATGIYAALEGVVDDVESLIGQPATEDSEATGIYEAIDDAVAGVSEEVADVAEDVADLSDVIGTPAVEDDLATEDVDESQEATGIFAEIDALVEAGATRDEAIAALAGQIGTTYDNLIAALGEVETNIAEDIEGVQEDIADVAGILGTPAVEDDPNTTDVDESQDPTGLFATIAEYEAQGLARDEATQQAISDLSNELGLTEDRILEEFGLTEDRIIQRIDDAETALSEDIAGVQEDVDILEGVIGLPGLEDDPNTPDIDESRAATGIFETIAQYEAAGIARDEATQRAVSDLSTELGITEENLLNRITEAETTLTDDINAISELIGKPATEVTQTDIDFVVDVIAGNQVMAENQLAQYDVTGDGQITLEDQQLLEQLLAGENVFGQVADTSIYAPTGIYGTVQDTQTAIEQQIQQNQEQTMDQIQQMEQNIVTNIEQEALRAGGRQFLQAALQAPDAMGQQVTVRTPDPLNLRYIYDFSSIFATPQQQAMFPSPYAKGGQVEDTTDKLLNIIGGS